MNAINDNNDPFEDIFQNRFADFESEPNELLWNRIEPQLPVNPTRRFPYWQISAVILGLFLGGTYFTRKEKSNMVYNSANIAKAVKNPSMSSSENSISKKLETLEKFSPNSSVENKGTHNKALSQVEELSTFQKKFIKNGKTISKVENLPISQNFETFGKLSQTTSQDENPIINKNNFSDNSLNPSNFQQSNLINTTKSIFEPNNKNLDGLSYTTIIFDSKNESNYSNTNIVEKKINLSIVQAKSYGLLTNHFKTVKLKFVTVPKEEVYYKERKPLEFYASAMPLLNYYTITPNGNDANFVHNISVNDDGDRVGFYTQAGLVFTLSDRLKLRTGLTYTKTNHSISYRVRTDSLVVQPADNKGVDISFADLNKTYSQSANYLGTKIDIQYAFLQGEALTHYVSIGGEAAYRLNGNHELNGFANFAYGITRQIGDNAYIFIEPTFSYSLNQQSDNNSLLLVKPNKIGFNIGVNFKIK